MRDVLQGPKRLFLLCCCFKKEKTGYQNEIKSETICKGHKIVWKLRGNAIIMVFMIFSFSKNYQAWIYTISNKKNDF